MKKKFFKVFTRVFATIAILHGLAIAFIIMAPKEDIIKVAEYRIYPPFIGAYVDRLHEAQNVYRMQPDDVVAKVEVECAENKVSTMAFVNVMVMGIMFLIATASYARKN